MIRWYLPSIYVQGNTICASDGEFEGWLLGVQWLGSIFELSFSRRVRSVEERG